MMRSPTCRASWARDDCLRRRPARRTHPMWSWVFLSIVRSEVSSYLARVVPSSQTNYFLMRQPLAVWCQLSPSLLMSRITLPTREHPQGKNVISVGTTNCLTCGFYCNWRSSQCQNTSCISQPPFRVCHPSSSRITKNTGLAREPVFEL